MNNAALFGSQKVAVREFPDGLEVKQLPLRRMEEWLRVQQKEAQMIELATGLKPEEVDALSLESQVAILEKAEELNSGFFVSWLRRRANREELLLNGVSDATRDALRSHLQTSLRESAQKQD